jgi:hypothetical protein
VKRRTAFLLLAGWLVLILATHRGARSPYSYVQQGTKAIPIDRNAAPDALTVRPVTRFFYDGTAPEYSSAHNLRLPLHSFMVATAAAFVRPYPLANELTNLMVMLIVIAAALRLAERYGVDMRAATLALATICALPPVVGYIGQPMHYIVGPAISFLVLMCVLTLAESDLRKPWLAALLTSILLLNYDWYVYAFAIALYLIFVVRFDSGRDALIYLILAAVPLLVWNQFLTAISGGTASRTVRFQFFSSIISGWVDYLWDIGTAPLLPLAITQIGVHVAVHQIVAFMYWPLVACCLAALWLARDASPFRGRMLLVLLVLCYLLEQLFTAAFDWENNPRRALPVFFVFAMTYCWMIDRHHLHRIWRSVFIALFVLTSFIAFADVLLDTPSAVTLYMGDTVRSEAKKPLQWQRGHIEIAPRLAPEFAALARPFPRARLTKATPAFVFANLFAGAAVILLFWFVARAELLPRHAPHAAGAVWLLSLVRFVV